MSGVTFDPPRGEWMIEIRGESDSLLLGIRWDGSWLVKPEDAPEAARIFAECVSEHFRSLRPASGREAHVNGGHTNTTEAGDA